MKKGMSGNHVEQALKILSSQCAYIKILREKVCWKREFLHTAKVRGGFFSLWGLPRKSGCDYGRNAFNTLSVYLKLKTRP